jgi:UDP-N-acetylmuramate: L-alanyl-gamma-D-glutamyl-meso-diaminopimelate ligase
VKLRADAPSQKPRIHFSGIGGTAMVAGARLALEAGWEVRGSDNPLYPPTSTMVEALGVPVAACYDAANLEWAPDYVVIGNVLSRGNPEVEAALERGLRYVSLPEWLKEFVLRPRNSIVIAGTHGKTTTTAITAHIMTELGFDPGFLIGGQPLNFEHSARLGPEGAPFIIEGDEYDTAFFDKRAKFLHYLPRTAVVTSIEFDHGDIYRDIEEIETAFQRMLRQIPRTGRLLLCADHPRAQALAAHAFGEVHTYGFADTANWRLEIDDAHTLSINGVPLLHAPNACLPGRHNAQNAAAAAIIAHLHGAPFPNIAQALQSFRGVKRRMEVFHECNGILFIDDFAHHPTAIRETIAGARSQWPGRPLIVVFEPRSNTTVTRRFQQQMADAFAGADALWLGPIHRADQIPEHERLDRQSLVTPFRQQGRAGHAAETVDEIVDGLTHTLPDECVVLVLSNGAFGNIYTKLRTAFPPSQ